MVVAFIHWPRQYFLNFYFITHFLFPSLKDEILLSLQLLISIGILLQEKTAVRHDFYHGHCRLVFLVAPVVNTSGFGNRKIVTILG